jgi:hypothetical protein
MRTLEHQPNRKVLKSLLSSRTKLHQQDKSPKCWPNLLVLFDPSKVRRSIERRTISLNMRLSGFQWRNSTSTKVMTSYANERVTDASFFCIPSINCNYLQKNPWVNLMISERLDTAIHKVLSPLAKHIIVFLS